jgi:hypothetical protein
VEVVSHSVRFSPVRGLWYCDVVFRDDVPMPAGGKTSRPYFPFLRLALARYQAQAITGARLSEIVTLDFIQLHPSRTLIAKRTSPWTLHCTVSGPMPQTPGDRPRRRVEALVQRSVSNASGMLEETVIAGDWQELERNGEMGFAGEIELPRANRKDLELVVRECELIDTADGEAQPRTIYAERILISS